MIVVIIKFIDNISNSKNISIVLLLNIYLIKIDNILFLFYLIISIAMTINYKYFY